MAVSLKNPQDGGIDELSEINVAPYRRDAGVADHVHGGGASDAVTIHRSSG